MTQEPPSPLDPVVPAEPLPAEPVPGEATAGGVARPGASAGSIGYVPGAWDMFHIGHLNLLLRARRQCDRLVVGVVTDEALAVAKGRLPIVPLAERTEIVSRLDLVDEVVTDFSSNKLEVWQRLQFHILFKGDDWRGTAKGDKLEAEMSSVGVEVRYFPYTAHTSSTLLRSMLAEL